VNQITQLRLPDGSEVSFVDWQDKPLYSTIDLLTGWSDSELDLFTYVVGDQVVASSNAGTRRTATDRDTNISQPGSMASTEEMLIYAIRPEVFALRTGSGTATDLTSAVPSELSDPQPRANDFARLNYYTLLRLRVSQKTMQAAGFGYFNSGFGPAGQVLTEGGGDTGDARSIANNGLPTQEAVRSYAIPVHIGGTEKYRVTIENPSGATVNFVDEASSPSSIARRVMSIRVYLDGLYKRPVA